MKRIFLLVLISPLLLAGKSLSIPDGWPTYNAALSPDKMYDEAHSVLRILPLACQSHLDSEARSYFGELYTRYLNESADVGHPRSVEWRINRAFTDVVALRETIAYTQVASLEQQLRNHVRDQAMHERCVNFLNQIRESGRVVQQQ